jgi:hypothetical protein
VARLNHNPSPHPARPPNVQRTDFGQFVFGCVVFPILLVIGGLLLMGFIGMVQGFWRVLFGH